MAHLLLKDKKISQKVILNERHYSDNLLFQINGWLGRAIVLDSLQCRGVLLLRHMVGQRPVVLAAGAGRVGC